MGLTRFLALASVLGLIILLVGGAPAATGQTPANLAPSAAPSGGPGIVRAWTIAGVYGQWYYGIDAHAVAADPMNGGFLVVWSEPIDMITFQIYGRLIRPDGSMGSETMVAGIVSTYRRFPKVAFSTEQLKYLVAYKAGPPYNSISARFVSWDGQLVGNEMSIASDATYVDLTDIVYNSVDDEFLVVWHSHIPGGVQGPKAQRVRAVDGQVIGSAVELANTAPESWPNPKVGYNAARNEYLVAFTAPSGSPADGRDIRARRLTAELGAAGVEFSICGLEGDQYIGAVAGGPDEFVVAISDSGAAPDKVRLRRIRGDGSALGSDCGYGVQNTVSFRQHAGGIAYSPVGRYLGAWEQEPVGGGDYGMAARYLVGGASAATGAFFGVPIDGGSSPDFALACGAEGDCLMAVAQYDDAGEVDYLSGYLVSLAKVNLPLVLRAPAP